MHRSLGRSAIHVGVTPALASSWLSSRRVSLVRIGALLALTVMGVVVTHAVSYLLSYPQASARRAALEGHAHLDLAGPGLVAVGVATAVALMVALGRGQSPGLHLGIGRRALVGSQLVGFAGLEVIERVDTLGQLTNEPAVLVGLGLQIPAAWIIFRSISLGALIVRQIAFGVQPACYRRVRPGQTEVPSCASILVLTFEILPISRRGPPSRLA